MTDTLPDRLSTNPRSPHYDEAVLVRDVGIRFKGVEKTNVEEYCVSEGWIRVEAGKAQGPPRQSADDQAQGNGRAVFPGEEAKASGGRDRAISAAWLIARPPADRSGRSGRPAAPRRRHCLGRLLCRAAVRAQQHHAAEQRHDRRDHDRRIEPDQAEHARQQKNAAQRIASRDARTDLAGSSRWWPRAARCAPRGVRSRSGDRRLRRSFRP